MAGKKVYANEQVLHTKYTWYDGEMYVIADVADDEIVRRERSSAPPPGIESSHWKLATDVPDVIKEEI